MPALFRLDHLDHLVLTVVDPDATIAFYEKLGMQKETFDAERVALTFGRQKINLHKSGHEFEPKAAHPVPGSADLCFITTMPLGDVVSHLEKCGIKIVEGPVARKGAKGPLISIYVRDPDMNLIEIANQQN